MITKLIGQPTGSYRAVNTDHATGVIGQPVTIAQPPEESGDRIWVLDAIQYSYSPSSPDFQGELEVKVGDNTKFNAHVPVMGYLDFYIPSQTDKIIYVTLKSGGPGVIGKLNCQWHLEPAQ